MTALHVLIAQARHQAGIFGLLLFICLTVGTTARAQDYLGQNDMVAILQTNAMCYDTVPTGGCAWAEVYHLLDGPQIGLRLAVMTDPGQILVIEQQATWVADAMCIRDGDLGISRTFAATGSQFFFDYRDQAEQSLEVTLEAIRVIGAGVASKTCFRFARNPDNAAELLQHTFADGARQAGENAIRLIPLSEGAAPLALP